MFNAPPPDWMGDEGKALWNKLIVASDLLLKELDAEALTLTCSAYDAAVRSAKELAEKGPLVEGDRGLVKNPAAQILRDSSQSFRAWCTEFGLTPAARKKLGLVLDDPEDGAEGVID